MTAINFHPELETLTDPALLTLSNQLDEQDADSAEAKIVRDTLYRRLGFVCDCGHLLQFDELVDGQCYDCYRRV